METERPLYHIRPRTPSQLEIPAKKICPSKRTYHIWMSSDKGTNNTPASITIDIEKINVDHYEIGVAEISFPNYPFNISEPQVVGLVKLDDNSTSDNTDDKTTILVHQQANVEPGYYTNYNDLISSINDQYRLYGDVLTKQNLQIPYLSFNRVTKKTTFNADPSLKPFFGDKLSEMLGFQKSSIDDKFKWKDNKEWYINAGGMSYVTNLVWYIDSTMLSIKENKTVVETNSLEPPRVKCLNLHTDIIEGSILNGNSVTLLRKINIPYAQEYGEQINICYDNIHYYPLKDKELSRIELTFKDNNDKNIKFKEGTTLVHLILRDCN
jgi:hypothetical protein